MPIPKLPSTFAALLLLLLSVLLLCMTLQQQVSASSHGLRNRPHIRCSACKALAEIIGDKMNETSRLRTSIQNSHRLNVHNKPRRIDYETSELRAIEIMEKICDVFKEREYKLREGANTIRIVSKNDSLPTAHYYGKDDKDKLSNIPAKLRDVCYEIIDDHDEEIVGIIRMERTLDAVQDSICSKVAKMCGTKAVDAAIKDELALRAKWEERRKAREDKKKEEEEKKEAKRKAKEEEERLTKEAEAGFNWRQDEDQQWKPKSEEEEEAAKVEQPPSDASLPATDVPPGAEPKAEL